MSRVPAADKAARRARFWADTRALGRPLSAYWCLMLIALGGFCGAVLLFHHTGKDMMALGTISLCVVTATLVGQATAIGRVRGWIVMVGLGVVWMAGSIFSIGVAQVAGPAAVFVFIFIFLFPYFTIGGRYSLRAGRTFAGIWVPLMFVCGAVIVVAEETGRAKAWHAGDKFAIWGPVTFALFVLVLLLVLVYLVQREVHRLHLWGSGERAPLAMHTKVQHKKGAMGISLRGWLLLILIGLLMSVAVAALSPYLFRTGKKDGEQRQSQSQSQSAEEDDRDWFKPRSSAPEDLEKLGERLAPVAKRAGSILSMLLMLLILLVVGLLVGWRPGRRLLTIRHCQRPLWEVSASDRIRQGWRLVEIALGDLGIPASPNEPAQQLYHRSGPALRRLAPEGAEVEELRQAAAIRDRVAYGLGVGPNDVELMDRVARWAYRTVWDRLGDWAQIKSLYRGLG